MPSGRVSATGRDGGLLPAAVPAAEAHDPLTPPDINIRTHDSQVESPTGGAQPGREGSMGEAPDIEYRGHFIEVRSYESEGKRWRPKAVVSIYRGGTLHRQILSAPGEVLVESEEAAETYSLAMAKKWIDDL